LLISTIAQNQLQAMQVTILILLPSVLLSGFIFPREAMPAVIRFAGYLLPLTYFLEILRGIILKGVGMNYLWQEVCILLIVGTAQEVCILLIVGTALLVIASVRFKKKLD